MDARGSWLASLELHSLGDFEVTPELDRELSAIAVAAQADERERAILFALLATKTARFSSVLRRRVGTACDVDDVLQETFIAFNDVVQAWRPLVGTHGPAGFTCYFLRAFPFRLRDRVAALVEPRWAGRITSLRDDDVQTLAGDDDVELDAVTTVLLEQICGRLNATDAAIFRHRVAGHTFDSSRLRASGITASRRTVYRRWNGIVRVAREVCGESLSAG